MAEGQPRRGVDVVSFGPFSLIVGERLLTRDGVPMALGGRALDVLIALIDRANTVVSKQELMATAWPGVVVADGSVRFQITMLRHALGDGIDGARYVANIVGRGYSFVAELSRTGPRLIDEGSCALNVAETLLGSQQNTLIGRTADLGAISSALDKGRLVTIVGSGGVGKTAVAVRMGQDLCDGFDGAVVFVDFAALSDPALVPTAVASMLRLSVPSSDPMPNLVAYVRDKRMLLILDNCEHVIGAAAELTERIAVAAPGVHILATSREALRVRGEHIHRLEPLASPPDDPDLTRAMVLGYPAARLFVDRAAESGATLDLSDEDARIVARICRRLDGVALSIELAARRVATYGLRQTVALLDERLSLAWRGQRTAPPRHQTLQATLDWSYDLLDLQERAVLCQLPVFVGEFVLSSAREVVLADGLTDELVVSALASLAEKSLVAVHRSGSTTRYRLLESTRVYALSKADANVTELVARRHALFFLQWLEQLASQDSSFAGAHGRASAVAELGNIRAALEWCFSPRGDRSVGVALASAAAPAFLAMSLLAECVHWSGRALADLAADETGGRSEMHLQAALALSLMFTRGVSEPARLALIRSAEVAGALGDEASQVQLLARLQLYHERIGEFGASVEYAQRGVIIARTIDDQVARSTANSMIGICHHLMGDQPKARALLEAAIAGAADPQHVSVIHSGLEQRNRGGIALARALWLLGYPSQSIRVGAGLSRTLWLQGYPTQAVLTAERTVEEAERLDHPVTLCIALLWTVSVYVWTGDYGRAEQAIDRFVACAESHSLTPYLVVGKGAKGELAIRRGEPLQGTEALADCLSQLHEMRYEVLISAFNLALADGLIAAGRADEAILLIDETLNTVRTRGDLYLLPELLRVKARALLSLSKMRSGEAEACLLESIEWSRRQGARAWQLRSSIELASTWAEAGKVAEARLLLKAVFETFDEGLETVDLRQAAALLQRLDN